MQLQQTSTKSGSKAVAKREMAENQITIMYLCRIIKTIMHASSLASSPHPSVSGLVMTVCACVDFPRKTWEFGYHRLLARLLSATVRRFSLLERQVLRLREEQTRAIRNVYDGNAIFPRFSWENQRMRRQSLPGH